METQYTVVHTTGRVVELCYDADALLYTIVTYATDAAGRLPRGRALDVRYCTSPAGLSAMYAAAVSAAGEGEQAASWPVAA